MPLLPYSAIEGLSYWHWNGDFGGRRSSGSGLGGWGVGDRMCLLSTKVWELELLA